MIRLSHFLFFMMITSASAPSLSLAGEVYHLYEGMIPRGRIARFSEGDTVVYHRIHGEPKTFTLGRYLDEGENGRVFVLSGTHPSEVIKFLKDNDPSMIDHEISSFQILENQGIPHARIREYGPGFYIVKDEIKGSTLHSLMEDFPKLPRPERTRLITTLHHAIEPFQKLLQKGPHGFEDLSAGNVIFDGKSLHIIDIGKKNNHPQETANAFDQMIDHLVYVGPSLRVYREAPEWLECYYDLQDKRWTPFLETESPSALKLREAFRLGHPVPLALQEEVAAAAVRESSSPSFREKIEPMLKSILSRGELKGPSLRTLTHLLSNQKPSPVSSQCILEQVSSTLPRGSH